MKAPIKDFDIRQHPDGDVTQYFGENVPLYMQMGLNGHNGIDIVAPWGTPMYAVESGTICDVKDKPDGYGKHVRFMTDGRSCRVWTYGHCEKIYVKEGQRIEEGDHIADMGNTGFVVSGATPFWATNPYAGTHLHIGYRNCTRDSRGWAYLGLPEVKIKVQDYDNGFKGNVDPYDMLEEVSRESEKRRLLTIISLLNKVVALYKQLNLLK